MRSGFQIPEDVDDGTFLTLQPIESEEVLRPLEQTTEIGRNRSTLTDRTSKTRRL